LISLDIILPREEPNAFYDFEEAFSGEAIQTALAGKDPSRFALPGEGLQGNRTEKGHFPPGRIAPENGIALLYP
jgi:hypothetical protein